MKSQDISASHVLHSPCAETGGLVKSALCDTIWMWHSVVWKYIAAGSGTNAKLMMCGLQLVMMWPHGVNKNKTKNTCSSKIKRNIFLGIYHIKCIIRCENLFSKYHCILFQGVKSNNLTWSTVWGVWFKGCICRIWLEAHSETRMSFDIFYIVCWPYSTLYQFDCNLHTAKISRSPAV